MTDQIISLSEFKTKASETLRKLKKTNDHVILTQNGAATAVVQDIKDYERNKNALLMLKLLVQGEADIRHDKLTGQQTVFRNIRGKLQGSNEKISD